MAELRVAFYDVAKSIAQLDLRKHQEELAALVEPLLADGVRLVGLGNFFSNASADMVQATVTQACHSALQKHK